MLNPIIVVVATGLTALVHPILALALLAGAVAFDLARGRNKTAALVTAVVLAMVLTVISPWLLLVAAGFGLAALVAARSLSTAANAAGRAKARPEPQAPVKTTEVPASLDDEELARLVEALDRLFDEAVEQGHSQRARQVDAARQRLAGLAQRGTEVGGRTLTQATQLARRGGQHLAAQAASLRSRLARAARAFRDES